MDCYQGADAPRSPWTQGVNDMPHSPGRRLREAWKARPLQVPGVFNGLVARMAERMGYQAVYLSGAALSASAAVPDVGLLSLAEFVEQARSLTRSCSLPV